MRELPASRFTTISTLHFKRTPVVFVGFFLGTDVEIPPEYYNKAESTSLLVCIPFLYRPNKLIFLAEVLRTLAEFRVRKMTVLLSTNTAQSDELAVLQKLAACYCGATTDISIVSTIDLADQYDLCWKHKAFIKDIFLRPGSDYTHFLYYEDDIRFSYDNFCYFLFGRDYLKASGLLPSFIRVEFNSTHGCLYSTDQWEQLDFDDRQRVSCGPFDFVTVDSVYNAAYVLDVELASEYVESKSFDRERSTEVSCWGVLERATLGLGAENVPIGFRSRYVVAVDKERLIPSRLSWIYHLPNNFTNSKAPENIFGQIPIDKIFSHSTKTALSVENVSSEAILTSSGDEAHRWVR